MSENKDSNLPPNSKNGDNEIEYVLATEDDEIEALEGPQKKECSQNEECGMSNISTTEIKNQVQELSKNSVPNISNNEMIETQINKPNIESSSEPSQENQLDDIQSPPKKRARKKKSLPDPSSSSQEVCEESNKRQLRKRKDSSTKTLDVPINSKLSTDSLFKSTENDTMDCSTDKSSVATSTSSTSSANENKDSEKVTTNEPDPVDINSEQYSTVNLTDRLNILTEHLDKPKVDLLYTTDSGPSFYKAKGPLVTQPILTSNLPKIFESMPIYGKPLPNCDLSTFFRKKLREFVGFNVNEKEFNDLENYCSSENLRTGKEIQMLTNVPVMGLLSANTVKNTDMVEETEEPNLCILRRAKIRMEKDSKGLFMKKLKYRGVRLLTYSQEANPESSSKSQQADADLNPGKDILYRVRMYRPYFYSTAKDRHTRSRHSVFCCDVLFSGRQKLTALRDRFVCNNDYDMRVDVSNDPDRLPDAKARDVFPSGFLFISNTFYVDTREGCVDYSQTIRDWALRKKLGDFPKRDMCQYTFEELVLRLGFPEVYVHQGNCEHVFVFSEIRLLGPTDPLKLSNYPCSTAIAQNQTVYCTTCAEFCAKWIVTGCARVPFDPAFFCDPCFRQYLYIDGKKIGDFKAYAYRGNAINLLKPQS